MKIWYYAEHPVPPYLDDRLAAALGPPRFSLSTEGRSSSSSDSKSQQRLPIIFKCFIRVLRVIKKRFNTIVFCTPGKNIIKTPYLQIIAFKGWGLIWKQNSFLGVNQEGTTRKERVRFHRCYTSKTNVYQVLLDFPLVL